MTAFLASNWSLLPFFVYLAFWVPSQIQTTRSGRRWDHSFREHFTAYAAARLEGRADDAVPHSAVLDQLAEDADHRRRRARRWVWISGAAVVWCLVRLPFAVGWV